MSIHCQESPCISLSCHLEDIVLQDGFGCKFRFIETSLEIYDFSGNLVFCIELLESSKYLIGTIMMFDYTVYFTVVIDIYCTSVYRVASVDKHLATSRDIVGGSAGNVKLMFRGYFPGCQSILKTMNGFLLTFLNRVILFDSEFNVLFIKTFYTESSVSDFEYNRIYGVLYDKFKDQYGVIFEKNDSSISTTWFPCELKEPFVERELHNELIIDTDLF